MALSRKQTGVVVGAIVVLALIVGGAAAAVNAAISSGDDGGGGGGGFDLTSHNAEERPHLDTVDEAVTALDDSGFTPVNPGKLTVASHVGAAPLGILAEDDNTTPVGNEIDIAQVIADGLGLELHLVPVSWADWPLGVSSGKYDLVTSNVTVTEERLEIFDIVTYRQDLLGFYVRSGGELDRGDESITSADDISGLTVAVGSGTNQEQVLLRWNDQLKEEGKGPANLVYYEDTAAAQLALSSGRVDATFGPNAQGAFASANTGEISLAGIVPGGWPAAADIGAATKKGNGLARPVQLVLQQAAASDVYDRILDRWGLDGEAVDDFRINPPGLAKQE
ncbi:ABC transporter substrate-binding protein [Corynebacterium sp. AOP40-9SA-29]|uniref:ABC transporter substrate-binding protein n=1 Tax=Corynebacterium sp. AOP40-9SA-29 TaxID=3457677 RepID=UPI004033E9EF